MTAMEMMEYVFIGGYTQKDIKTRLDKAMELYKVDLTEENYSRAGSALVTLRKEYGHAEMLILDYMIRNHVGEVNFTFAEAAGWASAALTVERQ